MNTPKAKDYYVSNKQLFEAYLEWYKLIAEAEAEGKEAPPIPKYIADCMMKICTRLAYKPNFFGYSFRNEMIGDAIVKVVSKARNFNLERSNNPFSFITTIAWNAFLNRIATESNETKVKGKLIMDTPLEDLFDLADSSEETVHMQQQYLEFLRENNYFISDEDASKLKKNDTVKVEELSFFDQFEESECQ